MFKVEALYRPTDATRYLLNVAPVGHTDTPDEQWFWYWVDEGVCEGVTEFKDSRGRHWKVEVLEVEFHDSSASSLEQFEVSPA